MVAGVNVFAVGKTNERCDGRRACFAEEIADGDIRAASSIDQELFKINQGHPRGRDRD